MSFQRRNEAGIVVPREFRSPTCKTRRNVTGWEVEKRMEEVAPHPPTRLAATPQGCAAEN